ncbi:MAG TPA: nucleotidyltransferase family protein [Bacteroidota bacterium]
MASEPSRIGIVILAAGGSERLGSPKQLLFYKGSSLIRSITKEALNSRANKVAVVLGAEYETIEAEIARQHVVIVRNRDWEKGIGSSIRAGVGAIQEGMDGILIALSDQPLVATPHLNFLIERYKESPGDIIASQYSDSLGVPALFPRKYFPELLALPDDSGAKSVILGHQSSVTPVPLPEGSIDIDELSDLKKLK